MKKPCALVSNVKNEAIVLPMWLAYYTRFFEPRDIYVGDDSSTDGTVTLLRQAGTNLDVVPSYSGPQKHRHLIEYIRRQTQHLLKAYDNVLFVESDEFVVPVTGTLGDHLSRYAAERYQCAGCITRACPRHEYQVMNNLEIIHDVVGEPGLNLGKPIMTQRSHAVHVPKFDNAQLWGTVPRWTDGYHDVDEEKPVPSNTMWLVHLHHVDYELCNERHKARKRFVDNVTFAVEEDEELRQFFLTKLHRPEVFYNDPEIVDIPTQVTEAF